MVDDLDGFNKRVKSIQNPKNQSYYDQETGMHIPKRASKVGLNRAREREKANSGVMAFVKAVLYGAVALIGAQVIRVRYLDMWEANNASLFTDLMLATVIALTLAALAHFKRGALMLGLAVGILATMVSVHNLMWTSPDRAAIFYTDDYVDLVRSRTEARSVIFRDMVFSF